MVLVGMDEFYLQLVDTAGQVMLGRSGGVLGLPKPAAGFVPPPPQDEYTSLPHSIIGIYSVTSLQSMPVVLVGNKVDLALQSWEMSTDEGKKLVELWGAIFLESSTKESQVTMGIFRNLIGKINQVDNSYGRPT